MKFENGIFEETYKTIFSQTGIHDVLTNKSFLSFMENLAGAHSTYCHFSFSDLAKENKTWILLNWKLSVISRPTDNELITLKTWCRSFSKLFSLRDFKMYDQSGNLCAIATSKWCLLDTHTGKISKMPDNVKEIYHGLHDESVFVIQDLPKLTEPHSPILYKDEYKIRRIDLDINHHVHNLNYLDFAYELLPEEVFNGPELNNVEIAYKKEIKYGDTIKSFLHAEDNSYVVVIKSQDEKVIHAIIKFF